eukprot:TRINITY_DN6412_c0_g1_i1.p1 TRINITY_DN6412_c0_g1~~TRINITY_DN6412_c0_g1_i1.p1  ORF type:complete len:390 (-),score=44.29 TRINITY_DN6412_c0_g1_i1:47-1195(-)
MQDSGASFPNTPLYELPYLENADCDFLQNGQDSDLQSPHFSQYVFCDTSNLDNSYFQTAQQIYQPKPDFISEFSSYCSIPDGQILSMLNQVQHHPDQNLIYYSELALSTHILHFEPEAQAGLLYFVVKPETKKRDYIWIWASRGKCKNTTEYVKKYFSIKSELKAKYPNLKRYSYSINEDSPWQMIHVFNESKKRKQEYHSNIVPNTEMNQNGMDRIQLKIKSESPNQSPANYGQIRGECKSPISQIGDSPIHSQYYGAPTSQIDQSLACLQEDAVVALTRRVDAMELRMVEVRDLKPRVDRLENHLTSSATKTIPDAMSIEERKQIVIEYMRNSSKEEYILAGKIGHLFPGGKPEAMELLRMMVNERIVKKNQASGFKLLE